MRDLDEPTIDSKYIQQHLANERTFLAWIRTSITIIGLGFLAAGVVFRTTPYEHVGHVAASIVGIGAVVMGSVISFEACKDYMRKKADINSQAFRASNRIIYFTVCSLMFVNLFLITLVIILLFT